MRIRRYYYQFKISKWSMKYLYQKLDERNHEQDEGGKIICNLALSGQDRCGVGSSLCKIETWVWGVQPCVIQKALITKFDFVSGRNRINAGSS